MGVILIVSALLVSILINIKTAQRFRSYSASKEAEIKDLSEQIQMLKNSTEILEITNEKINEE